MSGGVRGSFQPPSPKLCWEINKAGQLVEGQVRKHEDPQIDFHDLKAY
jgi:hypothetical protein